MFRLAYAWREGIVTDEEARMALVRDGYSVGRDLRKAMSARVAVLWGRGKVDIAWKA